MYKKREKMDSRWRDNEEREIKIMRDGEVDR
jgi:hypothetical protein